MEKWIIASVIPGADIDRSFLSTLKQLAKHEGAKLRFIETKKNYKEDKTDLELIDFGLLIKDTISLNKNLKVSSMALSINSMDATSGIDHLLRSKDSMIIGATNQRFKPVPRSIKHSPNPRAIFCTGTVSKEYYKETKGGMRAEHFHQIGALFVSVIDDKRFLVRQLKRSKDGGTYFNNYKYLPTGKKQKLKSIPHISFGDLHPGLTCRKALAAAFEKISFFKPQSISLHDWLDGMTISHHVENYKITKAKIPIKTLKEEFKTASDLISLFGKCVDKVYLVASNHPEHVTKYLDQCRYKDDYPNKIFALELALRMAKDECVFDYGLRLFNRLKNVHILKRSDSVLIEGIEIANHGDGGNNGAKASPKSIGVMLAGNSITGHTHSPEILPNGAMVNGTLTTLSLNYTDDSGGSCWMNTDTLIYPEGIMTHVHTIDGIWEI